MKAKTYQVRQQGSLQVTDQRIHLDGHVITQILMKLPFNDIPKMKAVCLAMNTAVNQLFETHSELYHMVDREIGFTAEMIARSPELTAVHEEMLEERNEVERQARLDDWGINEEEESEELYGLDADEKNCQFRSTLWTFEYHEEAPRINVLFARPFDPPVVSSFTSDDAAINFYVSGNEKSSVANVHRRDSDLKLVSLDGESILRLSATTVVIGSFSGKITIHAHDPYKKKIEEQPIAVIESKKKTKKRFQFFKSRRIKKKEAKKETCKVPVKKNMEPMLNSLDENRMDSDNSFQQIFLTS